MEVQGHDLILWYFVIINAVAVIVYGWDKLCAKMGWWRVPEITLLALAVSGGSIGAIIAMQLFRHKTRHLKFKYGVPVILVLQLAVLVYIHVRSYL